jgi:hypothetical protein
VVERFGRRFILYKVTAEIKTANVAYFERKIKLFGYSAYPDGSPSQSIRIYWSSIVLVSCKKSGILRFVGKCPEENICSAVAEFR